MKVSSKIGDAADDSEYNLLADFIEACIYAAAEHTDDLESCLKCFFVSERVYAKSPPVRRFKERLKLVRRNVSAYANAIKHQQARIRVYELEFTHDTVAMILFGFFIEGVQHGEVGPSRIVHGEDIRIVSLPSFLWELFTFTHGAADLLGEAVAAITGLSMAPADRARFAILRNGVAEICRLPNFAFDGPHPFERVNIRLEGEARTSLFQASDLYGSVGNRWSEAEIHSFGGMRQTYQGDGVTTKFAVADPKQVRIQHWSDARP